MSSNEVLQKLEELLKSKPADYVSLKRFCILNPVTESEIKKQEKRLSCKFPPSYRQFLLQYGNFTLGELDKGHDHLVFKSWPLDEHQPAIQIIADELGCKATAKAVSGEIGVSAKHVSALEKVIIIGVEGDGDFWGFDLRTENPKSTECKFRLVLFDDLEIEALAEDSETFEGQGFDDWLSKHIERRS